MTGVVLRVPAPSSCKGRAFRIAPGATAKGPICIYGLGPSISSRSLVTGKSPTLENREGRAPANSKPPLRLSHPPSWAAGIAKSTQAGVPVPPKAKRDPSLEKRAMENRTSRKCGAQNDSEGLRRGVRRVFRRRRCVCLDTIHNTI